MSDFDFVDFPRRVNTRYLTNLHNRNGQFSGVISLDIAAVDRVYPGSGAVSFDPKKGLIAEPVKELGNAVILGSSVKGAVRHVARAVSDGCIPSESDLRLTREQKYHCTLESDKNNTPFSICIICDMFGMMGLAGKISFSDFVAKSAQYETCNVPRLFTPDITENYYYYDDGFHIGYKFYFTEKHKRNNDEERPIWINAVKSGTVFHGEVRFRGLDNTELQLLMFSLGIEKNAFSHKLGGYRAKGFGTVNFICTGWTLNGEHKTADDAAKLSYQYVSSCSDDCYKRIDRLEKIMKYREG